MKCEALFNDFCFLGAFLPAVVVVYWALPSRRARLLWLGGASLLFYSFWDPRFTLLLLGSTVVDFAMGLRIASSPHPKRWLAASIAFNLGVLGFFKYFVFAVESARSLLALLGAPAPLPYYDIVLPIGISFYTFQSMSYTIDVYRREVEPTRDISKYLAFVTLFPQLVAGPIVRYSTMSAQLDAIPSRPAPAAVMDGVSGFAIGLFKKVVIADTIARFINPLWADPSGLTLPTAWLAAVGFALQLYFDFSGYSDMAIGLGRLLGFEFPANFRAPYLAVNPSDFWRRWHISLSSFLRDYLYMPLGGNRAPRHRVYTNVLIVMLLGGLWHGAAWTFVVWGGYHGALLLAYKANQARWDAAPVWAQRSAMLLAVVVGWVVFRAPDLGTAGVVYQTMFSGPVGALTGSFVARALFFAALMAMVLLGLPRAAATRLQDARRRGVATAMLFVTSLLFLRTEQSPFLYYQF